jgi:hypothetical protein
MLGFIGAVVVPWLLCAGCLAWFAWDLRGHG